MNGEGSTGDSNSEDGALIEYIRGLHQTELQLRSVVLKHLSELPAAIIASAADERKGSMEAMDDADFEDLAAIEWRSTGHELLGKTIFRPAVVKFTDELPPCFWYYIQDYTPLIESSSEEATNPMERSSIGNAKEPTAVERRMRFRAIPAPAPTGYSLDYSELQQEEVILTEAQVRAGLKAAQIEIKEKAAVTENPFAGEPGEKVTLYATDTSDQSKQINGTVVGHDSVLAQDGKPLHKILVLPDDEQEAVWATLDLSRAGSIVCKITGKPSSYNIQQFDYHPSSVAFQECRSIVNYLQRHPKSMAFLEAVDPVALNVPTYFDVIKNPMDISTLAKRLEHGQYSNIPPTQTTGRSPVSRMLNGPFRRDVELIFDNAMLFNPPDDWIHQAASAIKKSVLKKIEQISVAAEEKIAGRSRQKRSIYVDDDSDVDMYVYESDQDEDYQGSRGAKKRKRPARTPTKEDASSRALERTVRLQKTIGDAAGLRGAFANLPVKQDASAFSLPSDWNCRRGTATNGDSKVIDEKAESDKELDELVVMHRQVEENEGHSLRRSTRAAAYDDAPKNTSSGVSVLRGVEYVWDGPQRSGLVDEQQSIPKNRLDVELVRERLHDSYYATLYSDRQKCVAPVNGEAGTGRFAEGSFPPFLGRVVPMASPSSEVEVSWEIRSLYVVPALRWVLRGLIQSGHLTEVEPLTPYSLQSGVILANHVYFIDPTLEPFDVLDQKELQRRKRANQEEEDESEDDIELSEYEKLRAERVARNAERLKALGLA